jgi:hypothetical protein
MAEKLGSVFKEFFVEFLGGLLPGFFFMTIATPLVAWSSLIIWKAILDLTYSQSTGALLLQTAAVFRVEFIIPLLVLSYVMGSIFQRQDPKMPDQESAAYILKNMSKEDRERHVISMTSLEDSVTGSGGQFPYSNLQGYLSDRGLGHLASLVPWTKNDASQRTKMFINILKIRLHSEAPEKCGDIIRNEAHVRMMSSLWYAARALRVLAGALLTVQVTGVLLRDIRNSPEFWALLISIVVVIVCAYGLQILIRRFFHYQRVREIVYVLETAWFVAKKEGHEKILENLGSLGVAQVAR